MKRRDFLKLMGLASSTTAISACGADKGAEKLIPYLVPPDDGTIPGVASYVSSTCTECPANCGIQIKVREELPVKLEGLPGHPVNNGALCLRGQASLTRLYHPDRIRQPLRRTAQGQYQPMSWADAYAAIADGLAQSSQQHHVYLSGQTTGTMSELIDLFCKTLDVERLPEFEPYSHAAIKQANRVLFQKPEIPYYRIVQADFLFTVGADVLETFVSPVSYASEITQARKQHHLGWIHVEPHVSLTGLQADERFVIRPGTEAHLLRWLLNHLSQGDYERQLPESLGIKKASTSEAATATGLSEAQLEALAHRFTEAEHPLLIVGGVATAHESGLEVALLAGLVQWLTGMTESVVDFASAEADDHVGNMSDVETFAQQLQQNQVGVCFISRADPVLNTPDDYALKDRLQAAQLRVGLSDFLTDTMQACDIVLPLSHTLESWGDAIPRRGLRNIVQPVLKPIFDTRTEGDILLELIAEVSGQPIAPDYQTYLIQNLQKRYDAETLASLLEQGYYAEMQEPQKVQLSKRAATDALKALPSAENLDVPLLVVTPSIRTYDGRGAVLPLLNEIPDPLTTITYGNWISISTESAEQEGWGDKDEALVSVGGRSLTLPVKIQPGLHGGIFTIQRGQIDPGLLSVADGTGEVNCYVSGVALTKTGAVASIPVLSGSTSQEGRGVIPMGDEHDEEHHHGDSSMYPKHEHPEHRWAMAIDLASCTGCSACVAACYVENNVAVVGAEEHLKGREMSWLRIEPYYEDDGEAEFLPMMCQHCDNAPCEPVCPVFATYHNPDGLNAQVYNRCVGTRYCANNCPYKVRRFNWFQQERPILPNEIQMANPEVSIRGKGIMEKCTFCVQRIRSARDQAKDESRSIQDGEVTPACAQSCPTQAIVFGNILDEDSRVYQLAHSEHAYRVFEHLGTKPAVHYLKKETKEHGA